MTWRDVTWRDVMYTLLQTYEDVTYNTLQSDTTAAQPHSHVRGKNAAWILEKKSPNIDPLMVCTTTLVGFCVFQSIEYVTNMTLDRFQSPMQAGVCILSHFLIHVSGPFGGFPPLPQYPCYIVVVKWLSIVFNVNLTSYVAKPIRPNLSKINVRGGF